MLHVITPKHFTLLTDDCGLVMAGVRSYSKDPITTTSNTCTALFFPACGRECQVCQRGNQRAWRELPGIVKVVSAELRLLLASTVSCPSKDIYIHSSLHCFSLPIHLKDAHSDGGHSQHLSCLFRLSKGRSQHANYFQHRGRHQDLTYWLETVLCSRLGCSQEMPQKKFKEIPKKW